MTMNSGQKMCAAFQIMKSFFRLSFFRKTIAKLKFSVALASYWIFYCLLFLCKYFLAFSDWIFMALNPQTFSRQKCWIKMIQIPIKVVKWHFSVVKTENGACARYLFLIFIRHILITNAYPIRCAAVPKFHSTTSAVHLKMYYFIFTNNERIPCHEQVVKDRFELQMCLVQPAMDPYDSSSQWPLL